MTIAHPEVRLPTRASADSKRALIRHGVTLFLAGLLTGFVLPLTVNPRAGLAAHLEGVANGTFLVALGCAWGEIHLGARASRVAYASLVFGSWANWGGTLLSAVLGTSKATPLAGAGHGATPFQETIVLGVLVSVAVAMVVGVSVAAWHLWRSAPGAPGTA